MSLNLLSLYATAMEEKTFLEKQKQLARMWETFYQEPFGKHLPELQNGTPIELMFVSDEIIETLQFNPGLGLFQKHPLHTSKKTKYVHVLSDTIVHKKEFLTPETKELLKKLIPQEFHNFNPHTKILYKAKPTYSCGTQVADFSTISENISGINSINTPETLCVAQIDDKRQMALCSLHPPAILQILTTSDPEDTAYIRSAINDSGTIIIMSKGITLIKFSATGATMPLDITKQRIEKLNNAYFKFTKNNTGN